VVDVAKSGRGIERISTGGIREARQTLAGVLEGVEEPMAGGIAIRHDDFKSGEPSRLPTASVPNCQELSPAEKDESGRL